MNNPIQILAGAGFCWAVNSFDKVTDLGTSEPSSMLRTVLIMLAILFLLNYSLRSVDGALLQTL